MHKGINEDEVYFFFLRQNFVVFHVKEGIYNRYVTTGLELKYHSSTYYDMIVNLFLIEISCMLCCSNKLLFKDICILFPNYHRDTNQEALNQLRTS